MQEECIRFTVCFCILTDEESEPLQEGIIRCVLFYSDINAAEAL